jgi:hypothetical protein
MTNAYVRASASEYLGRPVELEFVGAVLDGDPFVYGAASAEDPDAAAAVLGFATGRLNAARPADERGYRYDREVIAELGERPA